MAQRAGRGIAVWCDPVPPPPPLFFSLPGSYVRDRERLHIHVRPSPVVMGQPDPSIFFRIRRDLSSRAMSSTSLKALNRDIPATLFLFGRVGSARSTS